MEQKYGRDVNREPQFVTWREKGIAEGIQKEKRQTALEMLREGLTIELIAKVTKLSRNEIEALRGTL